MKRPLTIPNSLNLYGQTIEVIKTSKEIYLDRDRVDGLAYYNRNQIMLYTPENYPESTIEMIFIHELFHFLIYYAGNEKLSYNEEVVQGMAVLFHQYLNSADYSNPNTIIPKSFQLVGLNISVERKKEIMVGGDDSFAYTDFYSNSIAVMKPNREYTIERIEVAFILQLLAFFSYIRHDEVFNKKIRLFNPLSHLIHQFLKENL